MWIGYIKYSLTIIVRNLKWAESSVQTLSTQSTQWWHPFMAHYWYMKDIQMNMYNWISSCTIFPIYFCQFPHTMWMRWMWVKDTGMNLHTVSSVLSSVYILWENAIILTVWLRLPLAASATFHIDHENIFFSSLFFAFFHSHWRCYHLPLQVFFIEC